MNKATFEQMQRRFPLLAGRYFLKAELGSGGNADVYLAYDCETNNNVAIKVMKNLTAEALKEAQKEANIMLSINHPHILRGIQCGSNYIVYQP